MELDISEQVDTMRDIIVSSSANGRLDVPDTTDCLEAVCWPDLFCHHLTRIALPIQQAALASVI